VVNVVGAAGLGKTRLVGEFAARHHGDVLALQARAYPLGSTASLGVWVEALECGISGLATGDLAELCGGHLADLAVLLPSARAVWTGPAPEEPRHARLLGALAVLLRRLSNRTPVIVTLDDVHLADGSSWEALGYLARNLASSPVLIVVVARPDELATRPAASDVLGSLEQEGMVTRLPIVPLSPAEVRELASTLVGAQVPGTLVEWLTERARGNPLYVTGLVRALLDEGADLAQPSLRELPDSLAERVHARVRLLDGTAKALLELLAVFGSRAELNELLRLTDLPLDALAAVLDQLERAGLANEVEVGRGLVYEVAHPLVQEAVYAQIGGARQRALHRHVGRMLVEAGHYGAAAAHVVAAAEPGDDEAIVTLCEALRRAEAGDHHREALSLLGALVEMLPPGDQRWLRVLAVMALTPDWVVDHRAGAGVEVPAQALRRIEAVLERSPDVGQRAAVKFRLGSLMTWGLCDLTTGRQLVEQARDLFAEAGDERSVLLSTNEIGYHMGLGDDGGAHERFAREVLAVAHARDDLELELQAQSSLAWALHAQGRIEASRAVIDRGAETAWRASNAYRLCYLRGMGILSDRLLGRRRDRAELEQLAERHPAYRDTLLLDFAAQMAWFDGDLEAVVVAAEEQRAWDRGLASRRACGQALAVVALAELGRDDEAAQIHALAEAHFRGRTCWFFTRIIAWAGVVATQLRDATNDSLQSLARCAEDAAMNGYWTWARWMLPDLAEAAADLGDRTLGAEAALLLRADPWPPEGIAHQGGRAFVEGACATVDGTDRLTEAVGAFRSAGWPLLEGRALALLGTRIGRADPGQAATALAAAAALFERCGAVVRRERALRALAALGSKGRRNRARLLGPVALTAREREVAALAAQGCSALQIAHRLFIGKRTVETHLANAYAKLGVTSKTELARRAPQLDL
jgi:DNA-binding CsgD family transcriptional regulator